MTTRAGDPREYAAHAGAKREFLAIAPRSGDGTAREDLAAAAADLAPRGFREDRYVVTAVYADLVVPGA